jgi:hypothetical protein
MMNEAHDCINDDETGALVYVTSPRRGIRPSSVQDIELDLVVINFEDALGIVFVIRQQNESRERTFRLAQSQNGRFVTQPSEDGFIQIRISELRSLR